MFSNENGCKEQGPCSLKKTNCKRSLPQEPYTEVWHFEDSDEITMFYSREYKVAVSIGLNSSRMRPVSCVLDASLGLSSLCEDIVEPRLHDSVLPTITGDCEVRRTRSWNSASK